MTELWLVVVLSALGGLGVICWRWHQQAARAVGRFLAQTVFRLRVAGLEHIPDTGPAVLVGNGGSYLDWLLVMAALRRPIRVVLGTPLVRVRGLSLLLRWLGVTTVDSSHPTVTPGDAMREASQALVAGELVGIFDAEPAGAGGPALNHCFQQLLPRCPAPIVPVFVDHVGRSVFNYQLGRWLRTWPFLPHPVSVAFGPSLPPRVLPGEVRLAIQKLSADCAIARAPWRRPVHCQFVRMAARYPWRPCLVDATAARSFRYAEALAACLILRQRLAPILVDEAMVGVWLPPSAAGAFANIALALMRKTSVNLNYTASADGVRSAIRQCGIRHVLTSRRFTARVPLESGPGVELVYLEDIASQVGRFERLRAFFSVWLSPGWWLERRLGLHQHSLDDLATVIFSSGSTGDPKGVMLTHGNIAANAESLIQAFELRRGDRILGVLPFFHSFGYTVTLWAPLQVGMSTVFYADPRQAKEIGELCKAHGCTIFVTTPTFLRFCLRRCQPDDFRTLRILVCGAEKLPVSLAQEFEERFGVRPLEGYGCTELSPAAASNVPDDGEGGMRRTGNKPGTIGRPLPGIASQVVQVETLEPLPPGQEGLLLVYGPNVMKGYLGKDDLTRQVIRDGWYVTGDMARIDDDGFITLTGRLFRFAKIGGEMVPLEKIEEELHDIFGTNERVCAVAAVPDDKRGERLVVLHLPKQDLDVRHVCTQLSARGLPNLWIPGERDFVEIPELPILGSGKLDLRRLKEMACELTRT
ncbi:MAG: AMP-binding protein [Gemmataceae bacterium]|nr:AMP-binding protein [Gemmataceae bacterium]MDW8266815.1 AMP-binding protein [Gemmataceae bacterium]